MTSRPHTWTAVTSTEILLEERCDRCELRRWRAPGARSWHYGDGAEWTVADVEPPCAEAVA